MAETPDIEKPSLRSEQESERKNFESSAMKPMLRTLLEYSSSSRGGMAGEDFSRMAMSAGALRGLLLKKLFCMF